MSLPEVGQVIEVPYPFVLEDFTGYDADGPYKTKTWRPGVTFENVAPDDCMCVADAMGVMILTVIGVFKPGRYPTRVFFNRRWRDPKGSEFGKTKLHIATVEKFNRLSRGYQFEYQLDSMVAA